jgi:hypothetical protein
MLLKKIAWMALVGVGAGLLFARGALRAQSGDYFPLVPRTVWKFKLQKTETLTMEGASASRPTATESAAEVTVGEDKEKFGEPVLVLETRVTEAATASGGAGGPTPRTSGGVGTLGRPADTARSAAASNYLRRGSQGIYLVANKSASTGARGGVVEQYDTPLFLMKLPVQPGQHWSVGTMRSEGLSLPTSATVSGPETVTVPAGIYKECMKVIYQHTSVSGSSDLPAGRLEIERGSGTDTVWLAPGVGTVKEIQDLDVTLSFHPTIGGPTRRGRSVVHRTKELTEFKAAGTEAVPQAGG